ncbi:hypothetical protein SAMN06266982_10684 [Propioniciclava tarda]|nr:hypothetical protein SAMN06266982_10684 [Propioniciclava tarda]
MSQPSASILVANVDGAVKRAPFGSRQLACQRFDGSFRIAPKLRLVLPVIATP